MNSFFQYSTRSQQQSPLVVISIPNNQPAQLPLSKGLATVICTPAWLKPEENNLQIPVKTAGHRFMWSYNDGAMAVSFPVTFNNNKNNNDKNRNMPNNFEHKWLYWMLDKLNIKNRKKRLKCVVMIKTGHRTKSKTIIITVSIKQNTNVSKQICLLFTI